MRSPKHGIDVRISETQMQKLKAGGIDLGALADEAYEQLKKSGETSVQADFGSSVVPFRLKTEAGQEYLECDGPIIPHILKP